VKPTRSILSLSVAAVLVASIPLPVLAQGPIPLTPPPVIADPAAGATAPLAAPMPLDPLITVGELENGLRYWIRENSYPEKRAELRLVVRVGSLQEDDDQLGLAHFVEHMAFNGTKNFPKMELVKALESFGMRFGAHVNASTSFDETIYFLQIPTDRQDIIDTAFQILEDWAHDLALDEDEIDKERGVVIEEWRLGLGAGSRVRDRQLPVLFADSRYTERLPIGKVEVLESFPHEAVRRFYRDWYRPDLMGVIVVGDMDTETVKAKIEQHFSGIPRVEGSRERTYTTLPDHEGTQFSIVTDKEATNSIVEFFQLQPLRRQAYHGSYRRSMVEGLFSRMFNRRLTEQAQQPNPPYIGARASQDIFIPTAEAFVLGAATPDGGVVEGLGAAFRELERVARYGFTQTELDRDKRQLLRRFESIYTEREDQESTQFAEEFTRAFLEGESTPGIDYEWALYERFMPGITLEDVNAVGERWLRDNNRVVLVTTPEKEGLELPTEEELLTAIERADRGRIRRYVDTTTDRPLLDEIPTAGEIVEESTVAELDLTIWELSNGARVVLKPTDFRQDQILFRGFSPGGTSLAEDDDYVAASSAVQVVAASGFGGLSARQITNMMADKVVNVRPFVSPLEEGVSGSASPRDIESLLQLTYLTFTEPRADDGIFNLIREQMRASLANRDVSPDVAFQETLQRTMSQDHPRRRPISVELLEEMDLGKSFDFYMDRFADASDFTFVFVGNVDVEVLRPLVATYLASLPTIDRDETWRDEGVVLPKGIIRKEVRRGIEPKSQTALVFSGDLEYESPEENALGALAEILQTRLREVMREELGGTYGVRVAGSADNRPTEQYSISIRFGSDPDRAEELTGVVLEEIERIRTTAPEEQELRNVQEGFRRQYELSLKENGFWLGQLLNAYRHGKDPKEILDYEETISEITPEIVRESAALYFNLDNYVQVSLLPEE